MIKIDTTNKDKWEQIEKRHQEWYKNYIYPKLFTACKILTEIAPSKSENPELKLYFELLNKIIKDENYILNQNFLIDNFTKSKIKKLKKIFIKKINDRDENKSILENKIDSLIVLPDLNSTSKILKKNKIKTIIESKRDSNSLINELLQYNNVNIKRIKKYILETPQTNGNIINLRRAKECVIEINTKSDLYPQNLFDYNKFSNKKDEKKMDWGRHQCLFMMGIKVCPYCQRNYITNYCDEGLRDTQNVYDNGMKKTTADLDHFYPQSEFPFLALSLYNFIPSCPICNSRFKLDKSSYEKKVLYPYKESFDDDIFKTKFTSSLKLVESLIDGEEDGFEVSLKCECSVNIKNKKRIEKTINMFGLNEVYKTSHNKYLQNMLENTFRYPEVQAKYIADIFYLGTKNSKTKKEEDINILKKSIEEIIKKPYKHKIEDGEPLGKLTKDILEEFGIKF